MALVEILPLIRGQGSNDARITVSVSTTSGGVALRVFVRINSAAMRMFRWDKGTKIKILHDDEAGTVHLRASPDGPFSLRPRDSARSAGRMAFGTFFPHEFATKKLSAMGVKFKVDGGDVVVRLPEELWSPQRIATLDRAADLLRRGVSVSDVARQIRLPSADLVELEAIEKTRRIAAVQRVAA